MTAQTNSVPGRKVLPARKGVLHVLDAAAYSLAGLRRLAQETAARLEVFGAAAGAAAFALYGALLWQWAVFILLVSLVLAVEALNTAIEVLTDRVSPDWSEAAKDAKDLGSLAVALVLSIAIAFVGLVVAGVL